MIEEFELRLLLPQEKPFRDSRSEKLPCSMDIADKDRTVQASYVDGALTNPNFKVRLSRLGVNIQHNPVEPKRPVDFPQSVTDALAGDSS